MTSRAQIVREYLLAHPHSTAGEVAAETGLTTCEVMGAISARFDIIPGRRRRDGTGHYDCEWTVVII